MKSITAYIHNQSYSNSWHDHHFDDGVVTITGNYTIESIDESLTAKDIAEQYGDFFIAGYNGKPFTGEQYKPEGFLKQTPEHVMYVLGESSVIIDKEEAERTAKHEWAVKALEILDNMSESYWYDDAYYKLTAGWEKAHNHYSDLECEYRPYEDDGGTNWMDYSEY